MKLLLKGVFLFVATVLIFSSCKKESSSAGSNAHFLKFKLNGSSITWNNLFARVVTNTGSPSQSGFELISQSKTGSEVFNMGITLNGSVFPTGTYTPDNSFMSISYLKNANTTDFVGYTGGGILGGSDTRYQITISSITDKEIKGTFTGSYLRNAADDNDLVEITEGEFVAERKP
jgi:hypothetical protein